MNGSYGGGEGVGVTEIFMVESGCSEGDTHLRTYFNAIDGDVDCIEAHCSWGPVGAVGSIRVGTNQHIFTGSVQEMVND